MNHSIFKKRLSAAGLAFCLCVPALFPLSAAAAADLTGDGSAGNPYQISTAADLSAFSDIVNSGNHSANAVLTADISLDSGWNPIGGTDAGSAYTGLFNGNSYTISLAQSGDGFEGLFAYNSGTVQNVTVTGQVTGTEYAAGIAAINRGTIQNCTNTAAITVTGETAFGGGITAVNYGTVSDSSNSGSISAQASGSCVGGIAGSAADGTITRTSNSGQISIQPSAVNADYAEGSAGGIVGLNYKAAVSTSWNSGEITNQDASGYTGGIAGLNNGTIKNTYNTATITGSYYSGGIAGYLFLNEEAGTASIHNTLNLGTVTSNESGYGAVCGANSNGTIYDNYYKEGTALAGTGTTDNNGATAQTDDVIKSGATTYMLNGSQVINCVWYQNLTEASYPSFNSDDGIVYRYTTEDGNVKYTNESEQHKDHSFNEEGVCTICGYHSVKLKGHSLTLDGEIGVNYYYYIDPMYYQDDSYEIQAEFTVAGRTVTDEFDLNSVISTGNEDASQAYGFQLYERSDEMMQSITASLNIYQGDELKVSLKSDGYKTYDYLQEIVSNTDGNYSDDLCTLAESLATYDYYANEYYKHFDSYEPAITPLALGAVTSDMLSSYTQSTGDQSDYAVKHVGSSLQLIEALKMNFFATIDDSIDPANLYMGYKIHGSADDYTYVKTDKYGTYYRGLTNKVPSSDLNVIWDVAYFTKDADDTYQQVSAIKTAGPFSYVESKLRTSDNDSLKNLIRALYLYYDASATYFNQ